MIKLGNLELDGSPRIAVSFTDRDDDASVARAVACGVNIAELRVDEFASREVAHVCSIVDQVAILPTIATIRHRDEGGGWSGDEQSRVELFRALIPLVDAVDVELQFPATIDALRPELARAGKLLIASHHDFERTPSLEHLRKILADAKASGADVIKIASHVASSHDLRILAQALIESASLNLVMIGMGPLGLVSRAFFPALGSLFSFAANGERRSAPGQLPFDQMAPLFDVVYPGWKAAR